MFRAQVLIVGVLEEVPDLHLDRICEALVQLFKVAPASALHCLLLSSIDVHQAMPRSYCSPLQPLAVQVHT